MDARRMTEEAQEMTRDDLQTRERLAGVRKDLTEMQDRVAAGRPRRHSALVAPEAPTCPDCGLPRSQPAPHPCRHCGAGAWEQARSEWEGAQQDWSTAREARDDAEREHSEAAAAWDKAQGDWEAANRSWTDAQESFAEAEAAAEQSEVEWEGARSAWEQAEQIHERQSREPGLRGGR